MRIGSNQYVHSGDRHIIASVCDETCEQAVSATDVEQASAGRNE